MKQYREFSIRIDSNHHYRASYKILLELSLKLIPMIVEARQGLTPNPVSNVISLIRSVLKMDLDVWLVIDLIE